MTVPHYEPHEPGRDRHVDCIQPDQLVRVEPLYRPEQAGAGRVVHEPDALPCPVAEERAELALDRFDRHRHIPKIDREVMVAGVLEHRRPPRNARNFPAPLQELFGERGPDAGSRSRYHRQVRGWCATAHALGRQYDMTRQLAGHGESYFALTCSSQLLPRPWPFRNGRAASTNCGARPIS